MAHQTQFISAVFAVQAILSSPEVAVGRKMIFDENKRKVMNVHGHVDDVTGSNEKKRAFTVLARSGLSLEL